LADTLPLGASHEEKHNMFGIKTLGITLALGTLALAGAAPVEYVKLDGKGAFVAHGVGVASIEGDGKFSVEGRGAVVVIAGRDDTIEAKGFGLERIDGNRHYYRGAGKITVTGDDVSIKLDGTIEALRGMGRGTARLLGKGDYQSGKFVGHWAGPKGTSITVVAPKR